MSSSYVNTSFAPGPQRVETGDPDPDFVRRPVGFTADLTAPTSDSMPADPDPVPDLWEGDQA